jgi:hypothetical protein
MTAPSHRPAPADRGAEMGEDGVRRPISLGDIVRNEWGTYEVVAVEDTPHGRLLKLALGEDDVEQWQWQAEPFVTLAGAQEPLFEERP